MKLRYLFVLAPAVLTWVLLSQCGSDNGTAATDGDPSSLIDTTIENADIDLDLDGIPNILDDDIDGDGILNAVDDDIDGDGIPNNVDSDIDGDLVPNATDNDVDGDGIVNALDPDIDGDGVPNANDPSPNGYAPTTPGDTTHQPTDTTVNLGPGDTVDTDHDGIPNVIDRDIDGDGILNGVDPDVDGDGLLNGVDADIDGDGYVNIADADMDGDGIPNYLDADIDGDGILNAQDPDADADGMADSTEVNVPVTPPVVPPLPLDSQQNTTGTSGAVDGSTTRLVTYGTTQYYWGDLYGNGSNVPLVMITHAVSDSVIDIQLMFNPAFVDNTYGTGSIGWNPHRFGVGHTFRDLYVSDHVELALKDAAGTEVWHGCLDYLHSSTLVPSGYTSLGPTGGDGNITKGSLDDVISFGSSLDENINYYGYNLFVNSPQTDSLYTPNPQYPYWEYRVIYRISVRPELFGSIGYGSVYMTFVHASPSKTLSTITVTEGSPPPTTDNPFIPKVPMTPPDTTHGWVPFPPDTTTPPDTTIPG